MINDGASHSPLDSLGTQTERSDLRELCSLELPLAELCGKRFFISGASGLLGSRLALALLWLNRLRGTDFHVTAMLRSRESGASVFGGEREDLKFYIGDIRNEINIRDSFDYIIHGASVTASSDFVRKPVDTIETALLGTKNALELAKNSGARLLYLSSLECYGETDPSLPSVRECDCGYIDPLCARSSYSEGKRMAECLCAAYAAQHGVDFLSARLTQCFGAGVSYGDSRVFAQFCRSVIEKKDIELHTSGSTVRSYCYVTDAVSAFLYLLARGESGCAYNVANMDAAISIREMALLLARLYPERGIKVITNSAMGQGRGYNPEMVIRLDSSRLMSLGWRPRLGLEEMLRRTVKAMEEHNERNGDYS